MYKLRMNRYRRRVRLLFQTLAANREKRKRARFAPTRSVRAPYPQGWSPR